MNAPNGRHAWTVTVGSKCQIVIPKEARKVFDINPGDSMIVLGDISQGGLALMKSDVMMEFISDVMNAKEVAE